MYYPILKNKLNELIALENTQVHNYIPIIELVSANRYRFDETSKIIEKIKHKNKIMIDIPNYFSNNQVIEKYSLLDPQKRFEYIQTFNDNIIPVISFYYTSELKESKKNNIKFFKLIFKNYSNFAIRLFTDTTYIRDDLEMFENIFLFYEDELKERIYLILDINENSEKIIREILNNYKLEKIILSGDILNENLTIKEKEENKNFNCTKIKNLILKKAAELNCEYSDYTVVDKIPKYNDEEKIEGFILYKPYLNYTLKNGDICKFVSNKAGDMTEYKKLCKEIINYPNFNPNHCKTCNDIYKLAHGEDLKYKAGATWKHRMITHHITTMVNLLNN
jgi:hypothetical protein